jgi:hypothetical protein
MAHEIVELILLRERLGREARKLGNATSKRDVTLKDVQDLKEAVARAKLTITKVRSKHGSNPIVASQLESAEKFVVGYESQIKIFETEYASELK